MMKMKQGGYWLIMGDELAGTSGRTKESNLFLGCVERQR